MEVENQENKKVPTSPIDEYHLLLTPNEVASILRLSVRTITGGICRKILPWVKVGGSLRMRRDDLQAYLGDRSHERLLERRPQLLGISVPAQEEKIQRLRLSTKERGQGRRRCAPKEIEPWEIFKRGSDVPGARA